MASFLSLQLTFYWLIYYSDDNLIVLLIVLNMCLILAQTTVKNYAPMCQTFTFNESFPSFTKLTTNYKTSTIVCFNVVFKTVHKITNYLLITNLSLTGKKLQSQFLYNIRLCTLWNTIYLPGYFTESHRIILNVSLIENLPLFEVFFIEVWSMSNQ
jgi:hypothetical protein